MPDALQAISGLLAASVLGPLTPAEYQELEQWANAHPGNRQRLNELADPQHRAQLLDRYREAEAMKEAVWMAIRPAAVPTTSVAGVHRAHFLQTAWFRYAAVLLLIAGTAIYLYQSNQEPPKELVEQPTSQPFNIQPGGNKAILTLADGSTIVLDSAANGALASQGNTKIIKLNNGSLAYNAGKLVNGEIGYNTISTPKGGQYQVVLPDNSTVWLNAASSIRFPTVFTNDRKVSITGEVFFDIATDKSKPFQVSVGETEINVLGTSFNVNVYNDESDIRATLVDGKVQVVKGMQTQLLQPGQQAIITNTITLNKAVNVQQVTAWKKGLFNFAGVGVEELMRQVERWYDVQVVYTGAIPTVTFVGGVERTTPLTDLLATLQRMGIRNKLEDRTITILP